MAGATSELAARRPVFHSERDFRHALAWQIQLNYPRASRRFHATGIVIDRHEGPPPGENDIIAIMRAEGLAPQAATVSAGGAAVLSRPPS